MLGLIIFGSRGVTETHARGDFHCPNCGGGRAYVHQRVRRYFTLYFLPVIPLGVAAEYLECQSCRNKYKPEVLELAAERARFAERFQGVVRHVALEMMVVDGGPTDAEVEAVCELYRQLGVPADPAEIRAAGDRLAEDKRPIRDLIATLGDSLAEKGKGLVLSAAVTVARADGPINDQERLLLLGIGEALQLDAARLMDELNTL